MLSVCGSVIWWFCRVALFGDSPMKLTRDFGQGCYGAWWEVESTLPNWLAPMAGWHSGSALPRPRHRTAWVFVQGLLFTGVCSSGEQSRNRSLFNARLESHPPSLLPCFGHADSVWEGTPQRHEHQEARTIRGQRGGWIPLWVTEEFYGWCSQEEQNSS